MAFEAILGRPSLVSRAADTESVRDRVVLVTGAGGSIGSALSRRLLECRPARLLLLDNSEHNLHELLLDLQDHPAAGATELLLGDLLDTGFLADALRRFAPDIVFHAAAFKQVPLLERQPLAAICNNTLGTVALVRALDDSRERRLVMISTDKAVNPQSIMGASKRIAELVLLGWGAGRPRGTSIRLGNVLGSRGSVLPRFRAQLAGRRPLTVTHPEASRYFMSTGEAVELILRALELGIGADLLVPNLGEPILVLEMARRVLTDAGRDPDWDGVIVFTGLRPGEKLREELVGDAERATATEDLVLRRIVSDLPSWEQVESWIGELEVLARSRDAVGLVEAVCKILPEYRPSENLLYEIGALGLAVAGEMSREKGR